jgi:ADP-heptose:LPS heptosyltransferase
MHLAAVVGVPCAIAFAARDKRGKWYPIGAGNRIVYRRIECEECQLEVCIERKRKCLTSISVDEMFAAAMDAWKNGNERTASQVAQGPAGGKPCIS